MDAVPLNLRSHTHLRRGKRRIEDADLHTTRLIGAGWTWDCTCGENGTWHSNREDADLAARTHRFFSHGQK